MDRRAFVGAVAMIPLAWPLDVTALQAQKMPRVGVLVTTALTTGMNAQTIATLRTGLREQGYVEGPRCSLLPSTSSPALRGFRRS